MTSQAKWFKVRRGLWDISIANENTVWAMAYDGYRGIYYPVPEITKTSDGGKTWQPGTYPAGYFWGNITALNSEVAWLALNDNINGDGAIFKTIDGGKTWQMISFSGTIFGSLYSGIAYVPGTTSTLIRPGTQRNTPMGSSYSNDGGYTWTLIDTNVQHYVTEFLNSSTGWSAGFNTSETKDGKYKFSGNLVGIKNSQSNKNISFSIVPNPSSEHITVNLLNGENQDLKIHLLDLNGKLVFSQQFGSPGEFFMRGFDFSLFQKGEYILKIENGTLNHSEKLIIK
jgi:hypothetical protein